MKKYHILYYVEGTRDKFKIFKKMKELNEFMSLFLRVHLDEEADNWIQAVISNVSGEVQLYSRDLDLE